MPFGLAQGAAYFTPLMQKVLGQFCKFCFIHMDDVLVHGSNKEDHLKHLKMTFEEIRKVGLK